MHKLLYLSHYFKWYIIYFCILFLNNDFLVFSGIPYHVGLASLGHDPRICCFCHVREALHKHITQYNVKGVSPKDQIDVSIISVFYFPIKPKI